MRRVSGLKWLGFQLAAAGVSKLAIAKFLGVNRKTVDGWLSPSAADARRKYMRERYHSDKEKYKAQQREWREANKDYVKSKNRKNYYKNKDKYAESSARWREKNRDVLRANSRAFYSGEKIHSSLTELDCQDIRRLYENGVRTSDLCSHYSVGPKAIIAAVRRAGGSVKPKTRSLALADSLSGFLSGKDCRKDDEPVLLYLNSTCVDGVYKLGITRESWSTRASKNKCDGKVYRNLVKSWRLPSRFHGWCIEECWSTLKKPSSMTEFAGLNGRTELREGTESELVELVDSWVEFACGGADSVESRRKIALLVLAMARRRSGIRRRLNEVLSSGDWAMRLYPGKDAKVFANEL